MNVYKSVVVSDETCRLLSAVSHQGLRGVRKQTNGSR